MTTCSTSLANTPSVTEHPLITHAVLADYNLPADTDIRSFGNGHINKTFLLTTDQRKLILQQINTAIFPSADAVVGNALKIEQHLLQKKQQGQYELQILKQMATRRGDYLTGTIKDLRALEFIEHGISLDVVQTSAQAKAAAFTFAQFAAALADFDAKQLTTVLPDFHNLQMRLAQLKDAAERDSQERLAGCHELVEFCLSQQHLLEQLHTFSQHLPVRVCHNDTKINNMLYSVSEGRGIAAIDLDTCMAGFWMYDFGDMVRTCCSPEAEDSLNTAAVRIRPEIFQALAEGYLTGLSGVITALERDSLLLGAQIMCLMIGVRFLTDHLVGDTYFNIKRENHNLQRAQNQVRLYQDLLAQEQALKDCIQHVAMAIAATQQTNQNEVLA